MLPLKCDVFRASPSDHAENQPIQPAWPPYRVTQRLSGAWHTVAMLFLQTFMHPNLLHPTLCALLPFCIRCFVLFLPMPQTICANEASLEACANCTEAGEW